MNIAGRQELQEAIRKGVGGIWLELTPEQYAKLLIAQTTLLSDQETPARLHVNVMVSAEGESEGQEGGSAGLQPGETQRHAP
jgi:hypothetical protein